MTECELKFIRDSLNLSPTTFKLLTEEQSDVDLLLDVIAQKRDFTVSEVIPLSPLFAIKLIVFKYANVDTISHKEKLYIAKLIENIFPMLSRGVKSGITQKILAIRSDRPSEIDAKYFLIASGLLNAKLKIDFFSEKKHILFIEDGFRAAGMRELASHITDWVIILRRIQNDKWFVPQTTKELADAPKEPQICVNRMG